MECPIQTKRGGADHAVWYYSEISDGEKIQMGEGVFLTNADRIRAMTDEELADWLKYERISVCPPDTGHIHCNISDICSDRKCWLDYLKQEVKDNA